MAEAQGQGETRARGRSNTAGQPSDTILTPAATQSDFTTDSERLARIEAALAELPKLIQALLSANEKLTLAVCQLSGARTAADQTAASAAAENSLKRLELLVKCLIGLATAGGGTLLWQLLSR